MAVIDVSLLVIAVVLMLSQGWVSSFHEWVQAKVSES